MRWALACLCALALAEGRGPRHLVFPEPSQDIATKVQLVFGLGLPMEVDVSTVIGYVFKCVYNLPTNATYITEPYVRYQRILEAAVEAAWRPGTGKACLLRAICAAASAPFAANYGILAGLLHVLLTPSSSSEAQTEPRHQEYRAAEALGRSSGSGRACAWSFPECPGDPLEYFSRLGGPGEH